MTAERDKSVLTHIQDAESWLSKARTNYLANNRVRGELDLSLAQAETKYAWELSRGSSLTRPDVRDLRGASRPGGLQRWWLPLAACLGLGLAAAVVLPLFQGLQRADMVKNQPEEPAVQEQRTLSADAGKGSEAKQGSEAKRDEPSKVKPAETMARIPERDPEPTASALPAPAAPSPAPADAAEAVTPEAADPRPGTDLKPASTGQNLGVDLGELERVARETLTAK